MSSRRWLAILIGLLVVVHGAVMATDPHAVHAADHDTDHQPVLSLVCTEDEAVSQGARVPLEPSALFISAPTGTSVVPEAGEAAGPALEAPSPGGQTLRALLQVFLN